MKDHNLYHEVIEIRHLPDHELICIMTKPYFNRHHLNKALGLITQMTENFEVISYQRQFIKPNVSQNEKLYQDCKAKEKKDIDKALENTER